MANLYLAFLFGIIYQWLANPKAIDFRRALYDFRDSALLLIEKKGVENGIFKGQPS